MRSRPLPAGILSGSKEGLIFPAEHSLFVDCRRTILSTSTRKEDSFANYFDASWGKRLTLMMRWGTASLKKSVFVLIGCAWLLGGCLGPPNIRAEGSLPGSSKGWWTFNLNNYPYSLRSNPSQPQPSGEVSGGTSGYGGWGKLGSIPSWRGQLPTEPDAKGLLPSSWGSRREADEEGGSWIDRSGNRIKETFQKVTGTFPNDRIARALFEEAMALYEQGEYSLAAERFERAAKRAADTVLREDAWFFAGESWFFADCYPRANRCYDRVLEGFDYTRYLDVIVRRKFLIARYWEEVGFDTPLLLSLQFWDPTRPRFDTLGHSLKTYNSIRVHDPTGPLADDAIMATAGIYFRKGRFADAAEEYKTLRKEYPKSEHLLDAHLLGLHATLASYQGPAYDGKPLEEAREITYQTLRLFGAELGEEKDRLLDLDRQITEAIAERDLALARFYEKKRRFGAARFYYRSVIEEYPLTEAARTARERLAAIEGFPDRPPNYFAWLEKILPDDRRR